MVAEKHRKPNNQNATKDFFLSLLFHSEIQRLWTRMTYLISTSMEKL